MALKTKEINEINEIKKINETKGPIAYRSKGEIVKEIKDMLKFLGYDKEYSIIYDVKNRREYGKEREDVFGLRTAEAVKEFQRDNGIKPTGDVDKKTLNKLTEIYQVTFVQKNLQSLNYFHGDITGVMDDLTEGAIRQFKQEKGFFDTKNTKIDDVLKKAIIREIERLDVLGGYIPSKTYVEPDRTFFVYNKN